jgi:hypothetical protein
MKTALRAAACGLLALACVPLAACNEEDTAKAQAALTKACGAKDAIYATWQTFAAAFGAKAKSVAAVTIAYNATSSVCAGSVADPVSALIIVGNAAAQIAMGVQEIKQKHPDAVVPVALARVVELRGR